MKKIFTVFTLGLGLLSSVHAAEYDRNKLTQAVQAAIKPLVFDTGLLKVKTRPDWFDGMNFNRIVSAARDAPLSDADGNKMAKRISVKNDSQNMTLRMDTKKGIVRYVNRMRNWNYETDGRSLPVSDEQAYVAAKSFLSELKMPLEEVGDIKIVEQRGTAGEAVSTPGVQPSVPVNPVFPSIPSVISDKPGVSVNGNVSTITGTSPIVPGLLNAFVAGNEYEWILSKMALVKRNIMVQNEKTTETYAVPVVGSRAIIAVVNKSESPVIQRALVKWPRFSMDWRLKMLSPTIVSTQAIGVIMAEKLSDADKKLGEFSRIEAFVAYSSSSDVPASVSQAINDEELSDDVPSQYRPVVILNVYPPEKSSSPPMQFAIPMAS